MDKDYQSKRRWYQRNKDTVIARRRHSNLAGKWKNLSKRAYTGYCELCGKEVESHLGYHHWNDNEPSLGLWLCSPCHKWAEGFDKALEDQALLSTYKGLKDTVTSEYYRIRLASYAKWYVQ